MLKNNLGYPRTGANQELKGACENYWAGGISEKDLFLTARLVREEGWVHQLRADIDLIPCNDFSFYDHVLDTSFMLGNIPSRYVPVLTKSRTNTELDLYFAMARGYGKDGLDLKAMETMPWFDTNYHYVVPEFSENQEFRLFSENVFADFSHARSFLSKTPKPVILGPVSYLLLGREVGSDFHRLSLLKKLIPVYVEILQRLTDYGADWIQVDEPFLCMDIDEKTRQAFRDAYREFKARCPKAKILLTTYFNSLDQNMDFCFSLPVKGIHVDLTRGALDVQRLLKMFPHDKVLSLGLVDGRDGWKNDYDHSLEIIERCIGLLGEDNIMIATSCSLMHSPATFIDHISLELEDSLASAVQKLDELRELSEIARGGLPEALHINRASHALRSTRPDL